MLVQSGPPPDSSCSSGAHELDVTEVSAVSTTYDALNRATSVVNHHDANNHHDGTEIRPEYNEAGLLDKVEARLRGVDAWTPFVSGIQYDAKRQRESIAYGNGTSTAYTYDDRTFRLVALQTRRAADNLVP